MTIEEFLTESPAKIAELGVSYSKECHGLAEELESKIPEMAEIFYHVSTLLMAMSIKIMEQETTKILDSNDSST